MSEKETPTRGPDEERTLSEPPVSPLATEVRALIMRSATPAIANHNILGKRARGAGQGGPMARLL
ncbi:hypothetical protein [Planotetraspora mira]|uniref:Uncharacterized protein n=1 Tax=Planotetraspora mira TaxID=58121 RepID=A0A8J3TVE5_9ACTN|nr:hypothetical protein [Planotetraspora mira]GII33863.1 hypothetical protein Pmi06nite_73050 [Planotetraspora mira]